MESVTTCPSCGLAVGAQDQICRGCRRNLKRSQPHARRVPPPSARLPSDAEPGTFEIANPAAVSPERGAVCAGPGCDEIVPPGADECPYCSTPTTPPTPRRGQAVSVTSFQPPGPRLRGIAIGGVQLPFSSILVIGRDPSQSPVAAGIRHLDQLSRRHASLEQSGQAILITDLRSTNGTFVDGVRISAESPMALQPGSQLRLGQDVHVELIWEGDVR